MALDPQKIAMYRQNLQQLDSRRVLKNKIESGMSPQEANESAGFSEEELNTNMQALPGVRPVKPGFSGAGPEEICTRYAIGALTNEQLADERDPLGLQRTRPVEPLPRVPVLYARQLRRAGDGVL